MNTNKLISKYYKLQKKAKLLKLMNNKIAYDKCLNEIANIRAELELNNTMTFDMLLQ